jgi:5-methylcytosine-specific restriction enzyme A
MPSSCLRPCAQPGCGVLVVRGRCRAHRKQPWAHREPSRQARGYGAAWERIRAQVLRDEPWCFCGKKSTTVDHIKPKSQGGTDDRWNLRGLCRQHQQSKAGREGAQGRT